MKHNHSTTSNTDEVFRTLIGCTLKGLVKDITSQGGHVNILVFECGWGLAFNSNGTHWTLPPAEVNTLIQRAKEDLIANQKELEHILDLAGRK